MAKGRHPNDNSRHLALPLSALVINIIVVSCHNCLNIGSITPRPQRIKDQGFTPDSRLLHHARLHLWDLLACVPGRIPSPRHRLQG